MGDLLTKYNGLVLYYVLNQQGDVVRLIDSEGENYGTYKYDAWGNILQMPSTNYIKNNPLRYRGYVYDPETELYYCQSRYYDPKIGRFLNADALVSTGQGLLGNNMFVYCNNNPIMFEDESGCSLKPSTVVINDSTGGDPHFGTTNSHDEIAKCKRRKCAPFKDLIDDALNFDLNNTSEIRVLNSSYFSAYKGTLAFRTNGDRSGSFGFLFITRETNTREHPEDVVRHEYGHVRQFEELGWLKYALCIGLPSWQQWGTGYYYDKP